MDDFFAKDEDVFQQVFYGPGASERVGELAKHLGKSALLVTDQGLSAAGHPQKVREALKKEGLPELPSSTNPSKTRPKPACRLAFKWRSPQRLI